MVRRSELEISEMCSNSGLVRYIHFRNYRLGRGMNPFLLSPPGMDQISPLVVINEKEFGHGSSNSIP